LEIPDSQRISREKKKKRGLARVPRSLRGEKKERSNEQTHTLTQTTFKKREARNTHHTLTQRTQTDGVSAVVRRPVRPAGEEERSLGRSSENENKNKKKSIPTQHAHLKQPGEGQSGSEPEPGETKRNLFYPNAPSRDNITDKLNFDNGPPHD
jgi:hypothetical protein